MSVREKNAIAARIRKMAEDHHVTYVRTVRSTLAHHITRLAGDDVQLDEIELLLIALQRSGHLSRLEMVKLQAAYLREAVDEVTGMTTDTDFVHGLRRRRELRMAICRDSRRRDLMPIT